MASLRTQIYLSERQRAGLDALRESRGASLAELIRDAVDDYLAAEQLDPQAALEATFGAVPDAAAPDRAEWADRAAPARG
jgi:hypothetical protein